METIYYHIDPQRLTACAVASGGATAPRALPGAKKPQPPHGGEVLQFSDYYQPEAPTVLAAPAVPAAPATPATRRGLTAAKARWVGLALDFCASAGIVVLTVTAVIQFLRLS